MRRMRWWLCNSNEIPHFLEDVENAFLVESDDEYDDDDDSIVTVYSEASSALGDNFMLVLSKPTTTTTTNQASLNDAIPTTNATTTTTTTTTPNSCPTQRRLPHSASRSPPRCFIRTDVSKICQRLAANDVSLTRLSRISRRPLSEHETQALFGALAHNTVTTEASLCLNAGAFRPDAWHGLVGSLRRNRHLVQARLPGSGIGNEGCRHLAPVLCTHPSLQLLDLSRNNISDEGANHLGQSFRHACCQLQTVILSFNAIEGSTALGESLSTNQSIRELVLSNNRIGSECVVAIATGLLHNRVLQSLDLGCNPFIAPEAADCLAETLEDATLCSNRDDDKKKKRRRGGLKHVSLRQCALFRHGSMERNFLQNTCLTSLDLSNNELNDEGAVQLGKALASNNKQHIKELKLSRNNIGNRGARALGAGLVASTTLEVLVLSNNEIQDQGIAALAQGCRTLRRLSLDNNRISPQGAVALGQALSSSKKDGGGSSCCRMVELSLEANHMGNEGTLALAKMLTSPESKLRLLNLRKNHIGDNGCEGIGQALGCNSALEILNLGDNEIGGDGVSRLARGLLTNKALRRLILSGNKIGNETQSLGRALSSSSLAELWLCNNSVGDAGLQGIGQSLPTNKALRKLLLDNNKWTRRGLEAVLPRFAANHSLLDIGYCTTTDVLLDDATMDALEYYQARNKARFWQIIQDQTSPLSVWSLLVSTLVHKQQHGLDLCYDLFKNRPEIVGWR